MWNNREVSLPFSSNTPTVGNPSKGITSLAIKYLLGTIWDSVRDFKIDDKGASLTLGGDYRSAPALAIQILSLSTGMEWSPLPVKRDKWGFQDLSNRLHAKFDGSNPASFPNLPEWIWALFYEATRQPGIHSVMLREKEVYLGMVVEQGVDLLSSTSRHFEIPRTRIKTSCLTKSDANGQFPEKIAYRVTVLTDDLEKVFS